MVKPHPRPAEPTLYVEKQAIDGSCPACGATELFRYPALSEGGWWDVVKCANCLHSVERERGGLFGSMTPISNAL